MGKFVIDHADNYQFHFNLVAGNNEVILRSSETYPSKQNCNKGIDSVRNNSQIDKRYIRKMSSNGKFYFTLIASNGEPIGGSQMYGSGTALEVGVRAVKVNAPSAEIEDRT